ncbi:MAG TPA: hypothetical protein VFH23_17280 [Jiangellaceae bacterium]|nr:hypothetical protein [Jiangellaceae bacterium]
MSGDAGGNGIEPTHDPPSPSPGEKHWEILVVGILALTALATAWSGYQASLWGGIQSSNYTQASGARTNAAQQRSAANQFRIADLSVFESHIDALISGNDDVADFYRQRFRDEFAVAYEAWITLDPLANQDAPASPLEMPEYQLAADQAAGELEARADALFADGEDANGYSDVYTLTTLLFAAVLFFAAISERFGSERARAGLLVVGGIGLVAGVAVALGQPITGG